MKIFEKTNNELAGVYIIYENPVRNEDSTTSGISHLLEHMICRSTNDIEEEYDENCLSNNAFTGSGEVVFYITGLSEKISKYREDYIKRITQYTPTKEDFDTELPIITQEYHDSFSSPFSAAYTNFLSKHHNFMLPIGTLEAIESFTYEKAIEFKNKYFAKPSKIVIVDKEDVVLDIDFNNTEVNKINSINYINKTGAVNDTSMPYIYCSEPVEENEKSYLGDFISLMFGMGLKSPLYQKLREKNGLTYGVSAFTYDIYGKDVMMVAASTDVKNEEKFKELVLEVLENPEKYLTRERFDLILNNRITSEKVYKQFKYKNVYGDYLNSNRKNKSIYKNLGDFKYEDVIEYYNRYYHPKANKWRIESQKTLIE